MKPRLKAEIIATELVSFDKTRPLLDHEQGYGGKLPRMESPGLKSPQILSACIHYDPDQLPPDLDLAKRHGEATRVARQVPLGGKYRQSELCPCCKQLIKKQQVPLFCHPRELAHLGECFPMYFQFVKFSALLLIISFLSSGLYNLYANYQGDFCDKGLQLGNSLICKISIMNKLNSLEALEQQSCANFFALMLMLISIEYFRRSQRIVARDCEQKTPQPCQFSFVVSSLPSDCTQEEVEELLNKMKPFEEPLEIRTIYMISNLDNYFQKIHLKKKLLKRMRLGGPQQQLLDDLLVLEKEIKAFEENFKKGQRPDFSGKALVICEKIEQAKKFRADYRLTRLEKYLLRFSFLPWPKSWIHLEKYEYRNKFLKFAKAPDPSDILWIDIGAPVIEKVKHRGWTYVIMAFILFIVLWILVLFKKSFKQVQQDTSQYPIISISLTLCASGVIAITNCLVGVVLRLFARKQRHSTKTGFFIFVAKFLSTLYFFNLAGITLLANFIQAIGKPKAGQLSFSGLIYDIFFIFVTNPFLSSCFSFFDIFHGVVLFKRMKLERKGEFYNQTTQAQANLIYENGSCDIALRYANILKLLYFNAMYGVVLPIGFAMSILGLIFNYWVDKYLLLRRWTSPHKINRKLGKQMVGALERYVVVFAAANVAQYFLPVYAGTAKAVSPYFLSFSFMLTLLSLVVSLVYHIGLPNWKINKKIFNVKDRVANVTYEEAQQDFLETYEMLNPITREEALQEFAESKLFSKKLKQSPRWRERAGTVMDIRFTNQY